MNHFNLHTALKTKLLIFHIDTPSGKKKKETHELYKQEQGKRKVKNSAAVFVEIAPSSLLKLSNSPNFRLISQKLLFLEKF